ncbi:hypothetical protein EMIHUDRAFT_223196 [Emiliania huxleyi CCMP1516]|uniref:N-acetyltransferase domain-containing protein n=2 Tax=Emiliania huxleyi TaxID=2903 RepID=A0A0D3KW45_EMIH1|nr:hypothetical protein EMIHUDRAFT_240295 [Emiliania huxleyi CCMP1516]XP_005792409.1 hypothetical protein EMIHUDRAFT_223196 [Emiliania huxleyi CCMP1516]EOD22512.1 hypothetical protein EMIHUDRAFT_240295 [Emiliania huxleyi CCMP1516]EOD39980.1 hypothetical protein EMIHUDRAFT_223196 [Emiliania huxleyi CCMP1516]|eukprot:XP_005774941.1 hypothetical protein EMIHUDRAFT_240295 [Emiliania huxleyi CCMP1516]
MAASPCGDPWSLHSLSVLTESVRCQLLALEEAAFPPCERLGTAGLAAFVLQRTNGMVVAEAPSRRAVLGFCLYSRAASSALITKVAVGAASRGRGVGSALVARALQEIVTSSRRPPGEVLLHVDPERKGALRMFGFEAAERLPGYYPDEHPPYRGRDALLMRLDTATLSRASPPRGRSASGSAAGGG